MTAADRDGFLDQLTAGGYVLDLRVPRRGVSPGTGPPGSAAASVGRAVPGILLLGRARDAELAAVAALLHRAGVPSARLSADELDTRGLLIDPARRAVWIDGRWLAPTVTWYRHFSARAIEGTGEPAHDQFVRESWSAAVCQLDVVSAVAIGAHQPGLLSQLQIAAACQIAVPPTIVSTDPVRAARLLHSPRVVIKALHQHFVEAAPGRLTGIFPVLVEQSEPSGWPPRAGAPSPVVVQEYIEHEAELRVYYVDGALQAFRIGKREAADPWLHPERVTAAAVAVPTAVAAAATALARALALRYAAFDFLIRAGEPVFLELDAAGDWRWIETRIGAVPVTMAVARLLCELHREQKTGEPGSAGSAAGFDLLSFLRG